MRKSSAKSGGKRKAERTCTNLCKVVQGVGWVRSGCGRVWWKKGVDDAFGEVGRGFFDGNI